MGQQGRVVEGVIRLGSAGSSAAGSGQISARLLDMLCSRAH